MKSVFIRVHLWLLLLGLVAFGLPPTAYSATGLKDLSLAGANQVLSSASLTFNSGSTLDASAGTLTLADDQIAWAKVSKSLSSLAHLATRDFADLQNKPTTLAGYGIADAQPLDSDLTAIAALTTTAFGRGLLTETSAATLKSTLALNLVDNTADSAKPISTATQAALNLKANTATTIGTTAPLTGGGDLSASRTLTVATATDTAVGVVELATAAETLTGTDTARATTPAGIAYAIAARAPPPRGGIQSAGTSAVVTTQDNPGLAFGTSDLTIGAWVRKPNYKLLSPTQFVVSKAAVATNTGWKLIISSTGLLRFEIGNGTNFTALRVDSTAALAAADNSWAFVTVVLDRDGNATFFENGAQLGAPVSLAASTGVSLTTTQPLTWFSDNVSFAAGTLGEAWIVQGLISASRIAEIYRAGSIATFCAMTPNATTGQNTATIDGLSFFQWLECDQGYGPIIRDRSGNNQHGLMGTTGLFHVVRRNPPGQPQRTPRSALVGDGSNGTLIRSALATQNPGTREFVLWADLDLRGEDTLAASNRTIAALTSTAAGTNTANAFAIQYSTTGLKATIYGATGSDYRELRSTSLRDALVGRRAVIAAARSASGIKVFLGLAGDLFDITYQFTEVTGGTPPAWTAQVDGQYLFGFFQSATNAAAINLYDIRLANLAMTEARLRTEYERGEPGPEWVRASNALLNTSNVVGSNIDSLTNISATGFAAVNAAGDPYSNVKSAPAFAVKSGEIYQLKYSYTKTTSPSVGVYLTDDTLGMCSNAHNIPSGTGTLDYLLIVTKSGTSVKLIFDSSTTECDYSISNLSLVRVGWIARLRTDQGGGYQARNDARSAANDATNFELSTTGITWSPEAPVGSRVSVVRAYAHNEISTTSGTTLHATIPPGWAIVDFQANVTAAFDAGLTLSIGTSATPAKWVNALDLVATGLKQQTSAQLYPQSASINISAYALKSGISTQGAITTTTILQRMY